MEGSHIGTWHQYQRDLDTEDIRVVENDIIRVLGGVGEEVCADNVPGSGSGLDRLFT